MDRAVEQSYRIAKVALDALRELALVASPRNIELWYAHVEGRNAELSHEIQNALDAAGRISQDSADEFYHRFIANADLSDDMMEIVSKFEDELNALNNVLEESGESAKGTSTDLEALSDQLGAADQDGARVSELLSGVISVAQKMREENARLETRLAESAGEVSTLRTSIEHIQREAMLDGLTGLNNRRTFDASMTSLYEEAREDKSELCLILADIDHFKSFNDRWGHQTGDQVLKLVAEVMKSNVKGQDILARYGGEEFAVILPETSIDNARKLAERIREAVEKRRLKKRSTGEDLGVVTISIGVAALKGPDSIDALIERADACLYTAKDRGRNTVVTDAEHRAPDAGDAVNVA
ncbi:MAG: GGDEF domain-containing protein [Pseudomonadota bacterium]